ncbi:MAG: diacylglycerol/lipid kinase family protein [Caulobacteraceae bacterium]
MAEGGIEGELTTETARPLFSRIEIVANERSGSVGPGAAAEAEAIARELGFEARARVLDPDALVEQLKAALDTRPDLLIVLAGDGTAGAAAALCGPHGPLLAPLPGGTMNMLPHALYGRRDWKSALRMILQDGREQSVAGGEVGGHAFYVAAILGDPTLWAPAREALRAGQVWQALDRALYAWRRCFRRKLRFSLDGAPHRKAEALALMCPLVSRGVPDDTPALEAAAIDPRSLGEVVRLGLAAVLHPLIGPVLGGDWRSDPAVATTTCREAHAYARRHIHAIIDGEPVRLPRTVHIRFRPLAFRALVPTEDPHQPPGDARSV